MPVPPVTFSVCMPVYNSRAWIAETLESLQSQTHAAWELVVIEDASPEPSRDIVEKFASRVPQKVIYQVNPTNLGCARSRDVAHALSQYEYIAPLDSDDIWKPNHLAAMAEQFAEQGEDFIFSGCTTFGNNPHQPGPDFVPPTHPQTDLRAAYFYCQYWLQPSSVAFRRRLFARIGPWSQGLDQRPAELPGNRDMGEDRNFFLRAFRSGVTPRWTGLVTTFYRQHAASIRGRDRYNLVQRAWLHNQLGLFAGFSRLDQRRYLSHANANAARVLAAESRYTHLAATYYFNAWQWNPLRIDRLLQAIWIRGKALSNRVSARD